MASLPVLTHLSAVLLPPACPVLLQEEGPQGEEGEEAQAQEQQQGQEAQVLQKVEEGAQGEAQQQG
jgi:hypothetical protein